jgi:aspartate 1-decarboxylase
MQLTMLKGKIHRCTVTEANKDYEGSVTISAELMKAAGIIPHEQVHVWDVTNGARFVTYAMRGAPRSGTVCINGAAANLVEVGDLVIIAAFVGLDEREAISFSPSVVFVDSQNRIREQRPEQHVRA